MKTKNVFRLNINDYKMDPITEAKKFFYLAENYFNVLKKEILFFRTFLRAINMEN